MIKKLLVILLLLIGIFIPIKYNLFASYNIISATIDKLNGDLIYPQCEYEGKELKILNKISSEMSFSVVYTNCEVFYTKGMKDYCKIMDKEISEINGDDWLNKLYRKRK